jgi:hypothetical protein
MKSKRGAHPDLQSQLESLLDQVWRSEADWRLWDRVDAFVMLESLRLRRAKRATDHDGVAPDLRSDNAA